MYDLNEKLVSLGIFIQNDYFIKYLKLIKSNINNTEQKYITQKHHIIPKYYFKRMGLEVDNSKTNIVNLEFSEHVMAHYYLINCCLNEEDVVNNIHAFNILLKKQGHKLDEEELKYYLQEAKKLEEKRLSYVSKISKLKNSGGKYVYKGDQVRHVKESQVEIYLKDGWKTGNPKAAHKDKSKRYCVTDGKTFKRVHKEDIKNYIDKGWHLGITEFSEETRLKLSKKLKGHRCNTKNKIVINNGDTNRFIIREELPIYEYKGWKLGSKPRSEEFKKQTGDRIRGRIHINNGIISKMVYKEDLKNYINNGWVEGRIWKKNKK